MTDATAAGMAPASLLRRAAPFGATGVVHDISAADAGWRYVAFAEHRLAIADGLVRDADHQEVAVVVVEGSVGITAGPTTYSSVGSRDGVFDGPAAPVLLVAPGLPIEIKAETPASIILAAAPGGDVQTTRLIDTPDIRVETRGHGVTERRIHHLLPPQEEAGRLILFEVFTPGGNWSSYPPHKHDTENPPTEAYLEELYYYRFARPEGWAFQRLYTDDRSLDVAFTPVDRDVVLVPRGYHPVGMPAGYDGYYLNVMAGHHRAWHFTVDPDHRWLMDWDPAAPR